MATYVNASTTLVQVDTSQTGPYIVLLSSLNAPGSLVTIRDSIGAAAAKSTGNYIVVSTTKGVNFLDGSFSNLITQPYGFLTITPKTPTVWGIVNTFAFPDASTTANLSNINVSSISISSIAYIQQAIISTASISTICTNNVYITDNLSVGQSTIAHAGFFMCSLRSYTDILAASNIYAGSTISTLFANIGSTLYAPYISTTDLYVNGGLQTASSISTAGPMFVGSSISTTGDLAVGASTFVAGQLMTGSLLTLSNAMVGGSLSVMSSLYAQWDIFTPSSILAQGLSTINNVNIGENLSVLGNVFINKELYTTSSILTTGTISTLENLNVSSNLSVLGNVFIANELYTTSSILATGTISTLQNVNVSSNLSVLGNVFIAKELYTTSSIFTRGSISTLEDLNVARNVSILGNLYVQGSVQFSDKEVELQDVIVSSLVSKGPISTISSLSAGGYLNIAGSTILTGTVSALSNFHVAGLFSTASTVVIGDSLLVANTGYFASHLSISSFVNISENLNVAGSVTVQNIAVTLSTAISTLAVTNTVGFGLNVSASMLVAGLFSTSGSMNIGGRISTPNVLAVGSTIDTQHLSVRTGMSVFSNVGFAQDIFARSSLVVGNSTITRSLYANIGNVLNTLTVGPSEGQGSLSNYGSFSNGGTAVFSGAVNVQGVTTLSNVLNIAPFNNFLGNATNRISNDTFMASLTTSYQSTVGQAAFYSSVQIQGGLSVFSSLTATNINFTGILYSNGAVFQGGGAGIPGINSVGTIGINSASNASYSLFVSGDIVASGNVTAQSDIRKKDNIVTIDSPLEKILKMRGVYYTRTDSDNIDANPTKPTKPTKHTRQVGVIAQEVEEIIPEVVMTDTSDDKFKSVAYGNIVALLIEGMKAQQSTIDYLLKRNV